MNTLTPEEQNAQEYLVKHYGPEIECVPLHWIKAVAGYAKERDALLKEAKKLLLRAYYSGDPPKCLMDEIYLFTKKLNASVK